MISFSRAFRECCVIVLLLQSHFILGQQIDFISGILINTENNSPIPFATIKIKNKSKGLISNLDGGFKIPYDLINSNDTLVISSIGYNSKEVVISRLSTDEINYIKLTEKVEVLNEVVLVDSKISKRLNAKEIVRKAIEVIPENFPFESFSYIGYYRDYQLKAKEYINLNEAILEVFDKGFGFEDIKKTQTKIYQYKTNSDFRIDTLASKPYDYVNKSKIISSATLAGQGGNEYTILRLHDALRNYKINTYDFVNRLDIDLIKNHRLKLLDETSLNDTPLYAIKIAKNEGSYKVFGRIYISKGDFRIYKMEYEVYSKGKNSGKLLYQIIVEYQLYEDKMYPNYISFNNSFEILKPPKFIPDTVKINHDRKFFEVVFNNPPLPSSARKKHRYKLWYQNIYLAIDSVIIKNNSARIYPKYRNWVFDGKRIKSQRKTTKKGATVEVKNIVDVYGNKIYESESESYNQFREFFVQELKTISSKPIDSIFMVKTKPIKSQQIAPLKNISEYWMNTPLKNN